MSLLSRSLSAGVGSALHLRTGRVNIPLRWVLVAWVLRRIGRAIGWLATHPRVLLAAAAAAGVWWLIDRAGKGPVLAASFVTVAMLAAWAWLHPASFDRWVEHPARARWRRMWTYRRWWQPAMVTARLALDVGYAQHLPRLVRVRCTDGADVVRVRMLAGQTLADWTGATERLAQTFGVLAVRVLTVPKDNHLLDLWCLTRDPLQATVPALLPPADPVDLQAVPVGVREDGQGLLLPLLYTHVLVAGETGAGKGSALWSYLLGVAPAVRDGLVKVWAIDPKGGLELTAGAPLFDRFVWGEPQPDGTAWQEPIARLLEDAVTGMQARAARYRGATRKMQPTVAEPLLLLVIDEVASLTAYVTDPALRARINAALSLLLSQGRAVGVTLLAATQDPRKEVLAMRNLFPTRVALRAAEPTEADMVLGGGSRSRGALTDRIDHRTPGVAYVVQDGHPEPVRARFTYATDEQIAAVAAEYAPLPAVAPPLPAAGYVA